MSATQHLSAQQNVNFVAALDFPKGKIGAVRCRDFKLFSFFRSERNKIKARFVAFRRVAVLFEALVPPQRHSRPVPPSLEGGAGG